MHLLLTYVSAICMTAHRRPALYSRSPRFKSWSWKLINMTECPEERNKKETAILFSAEGRGTNSLLIGHRRKYTEWWWAMTEANKVIIFLSFYFWVATLYRTNGSSTSIPIPSFFPHPLLWLTTPVLCGIFLFNLLHYKKPVSQPGSHLWNFDCNKLISSEPTLDNSYALHIISK